MMYSSNHQIFLFPCNTKDGSMELCWVEEHQNIGWHINVHHVKSHMKCEVKHNGYMGVGAFMAYNGINGWSI